MSKILLNNLTYSQPQGRVAIASRFDLDSAFFFPSSPNIAVDLVRGYTAEHPPSVSFVPSDRGVAAKYSGAAVVGTALAAGSFTEIIPIASPFWVVIAFRIETTGTRRILYSDFNSGGQGNSVAVLFEQTASNTYRWYIGSPTPYTVTHSAPVTVGWHVAVLDFAPGGPARMSLDGGAFESSAVGSGSRYAGTRLRAGSAGELTSIPFNGQIETIAVSRLMLPDDVLRSIGSDPWQLFRDDPEVLYFDVPAGIETATADGAPDAVSLTAPTGAAAVSVAASGALDAVTLTAPTGAAAVSVTAAGAVAPLSLAAPAGAAAVEVTASGAIDGVSLTAPNGTADTVETVIAAGAVAALSLSAPTGAAAVEVAAAGAIDAVSLTAPNGTASTVSTVIAAGAVAPLSLSAPTGAAAVDVAAAGAIDAVTLTAPNGTASTVTTVVAAGAVAPLSLSAPVGAADVAVAVAGLISEITLSAPAGNASTGATVTAAGAIAPLSLTPPTGAHAVSVAAFGDVRRLQFVPPTGSASDGSVSYLPRPGFTVGASIRRRFDA